MDETKMNFYLEKIPEEIRYSIKQLNNDQRWAVYLSVMFNGRRSFTELKDEFDANSNEINRALDSLADGGLIAKRVEKLSDIQYTGNRKKILYYSTHHGRTLLNCLYDTIPTKNTVIRPSVTQYRYFTSSEDDKRITGFNPTSSMARTDKSVYGLKPIPQAD